MPCWPTLLRLKVAAFTAAEDGCSAQTETKMKCPASASRPGSFGLHHCSRECYLKAGTGTQQRSGELMPPSSARLQLQSSRWRRYRRAPLQLMTPPPGATGVCAIDGPDSAFPGSHFLG